MHNFRHLTFLAVLAAALAVFAIFAPAARAVPRVVATIPPLHGLLMDVMKGAGAPILLLKDGGDPHHHALRPSEAGALARADAVFLISYDLERFLKERLPRLATRAKIVELARAPGVKLLPRRDLDPLWVFGRTAAGTAVGKTPDLHIWTGPENGAAVAMEMARVLGELDPANAETYHRNAKALEARIREVTVSLEGILAPLNDRPYIVTHDATQYFERRFRLAPLAAVEPPGGARPGMRRISAVVRLARRHPGICVFTGPGEGGRWARLLEREAGARRGVLDPLGHSLPQGEGFYPRLLQSLGRAFAKCLKAEN